MNQTVLIYVERDRAKIVSELSEDLTERLCQELGYTKKVAKKDWVTVNGRRRMKVQMKEQLVTKYNTTSKTFPVGMLDRTKRFFKNKGFKIKVKDNRPKPEIDKVVIADRISTFPMALRPYQIDAVAIGIASPHMVYFMATGSGKGVLFTSLIHALNVKSLVLVSRGDLLSQHFAMLKKNLEFDVGIIQGKRLDYDKQVCVATTQTLYNRIKNKDKAVFKYLQDIRYLVIDESHHSQAMSYRSIARFCTNAVYKHGFSGTPWDYASSNIELEAVCGPIKYRATTSDLIRLGYLAKPIITFHKYRGNSDYVETDNLQRMYADAIVNNEKRNAIVLDVVMEEYNRGNKMLLVVNRIAHGEILAAGLRKRGIHDREIGYLHGSKGRIQRESGRKEFERGDVQIMIVSQIWNEGIDINAIDTVVKADAYGGGEVHESEGVRNMVQQIGRALRKPLADNANDIDTAKEHIVHIHDFADKQNHILERWTRNRYRSCKMEPEFVVEVV